MCFKLAQFQGTQDKAEYFLLLIEEFVFVFSNILLKTVNMYMLLQVHIHQMSVINTWGGVHIQHPYCFGFLYHGAKLPYSLLLPFYGTSCHFSFNFK